MTIKDRGLRILNLATYNAFNQPELVEKFQIQCPYDNQYILRMLVRKGLDDYLIPSELSWIKSLLFRAGKYQNEQISIRHSFCYITIRRGLVRSVTDDEWHVDGFSTRISHIPEQNYIWSDVWPTEFMIKPIEFPTEFNPVKHNIHKFIQSAISERDEIQAAQENSLYCFDPYVIHRRPNVPKNVKRTMVRISFTPIEIQDKNNTPNPLMEGKDIYNRDGVKEFRNQLICFSKHDYE